VSFSRAEGAIDANKKKDGRECYLYNDSKVEKKFFTARDNR